MKFPAMKRLGPIAQMGFNTIAYMGCKFEVQKVKKISFGNFGYKSALIIMYIKCNNFWSASFPVKVRCAIVKKL